MIATVAEISAHLRDAIVALVKTELFDTVVISVKLATVEEEPRRVMAEYAVSREVTDGDPTTEIVDVLSRVAGELVEARARRRRGEN